MAEFDRAAWGRAQRQTEASARRVAAQDAKNRRPKSGGGGSKIQRGGSTAARATRGQSSWTSAGKTPPLLLKIHAGSRAGDGYSERQDGAQIIDKNILGRDARERADYWKLDEARHPRVDPKNLFVHVSMSRPAGEELTPDQWQKVTREFLKNIGAEGCQFVCTRHTSTANDHVHLVFHGDAPTGR